MYESPPLLRIMSGGFCSYALYISKYRPASSALRECDDAPPSDNQGHAVHECDLCELAQRGLVVLYIAHDKEHAQRVHVREALDARVDVLGVQAVVPQAA